MICKIDIPSIKADIGEMSENKQRIIVSGSLGRSKSFEKEATIEKAYSNIFIVKYDNEDKNVTYNYTDVLTRTVELQIFNGESYVPFMPPVIEKTRKIKNL